MFKENEWDEVIVPEEEDELLACVTSKKAKLDPEFMSWVKDREKEIGTEAMKKFLERVSRQDTNKALHPNGLRDYFLYCKSIFAEATSGKPSDKFVNIRLPIDAARSLKAVLDKAVEGLK